MVTDISVNCIQSLHPMAEYHAAARAVGGCAVYVRLVKFESDKFRGFTFSRVPSYLCFHTYMQR